MKRCGWKAGLLVALGLASCGTAIGGARHRTPVPARAPADEPATLWDPRYHIINDTVYVSGSYVRDLAMVLFRADATQAQRQAAVDLVHGEVVGGHRLANGADGYYFIRIPGDDYPRPLMRALDKLRPLPQVLSATPYFVDNALRLLPAGGRK